LEISSDIRRIPTSKRYWARKLGYVGLAGWLLRDWYIRQECKVSSQLKKDNFAYGEIVWMINEWVYGTI